MAAPLLGVTPMYAICFLGYRIGQDLQRTSPSQTVRVQGAPAAVTMRESLSVVRHGADPVDDQPAWPGGRALGRVHHGHHGAWRSHQGDPAGVWPPHGAAATGGPRLRTHRRAWRGTDARRRQQKVQRAVGRDAQGLPGGRRPRLVQGRVAMPVCPPTHPHLYAADDAGLPRVGQGTNATLLRDVPGSYAYFAAYEYSKRALAPGPWLLPPPLPPPPARFRRALAV
jgi:hypothetical protein